jgi:tetratricopeptide (TPR) repeat protein
MKKDTVSCPLCHFDNPTDTFFCGKCGAKLGTERTPEYSKTMTLETPAEGLSRGTLFAGRYEVIEELGRGGMGSVFRVEDKKLNEEIALKLIKPEIAAEGRVVERFRNEIKTARKIRHKNVCGMYDFHEEGKTLYLTMEYVRGEDLRSVIHRMKALTFGTAVSVARQVAEGLAEAHKLGIIHRDLKPGNIMIDKDGLAKIMDFGIARARQEKGVTGEGTMLGTPEYMSPEQVEGKPADARSDLYALGVIIFEMVVGYPPFEGDTAFSIAAKHKTEPPPAPRELLPQIQEGLNKLILRCLEKDKERRYQTAEELIADLEKIEKDMTTTERPVPKRGAGTSKPITVTLGPKKMLIPAAVIALIAIAAVIWLLFLKKAAPLPPEEKCSIAVIGFENQTDEPAYDSLGKVIQNLLITNLEQSGYFYVATWQRLRDLLKQMGKGEVEFIDPDLGFELCRMDGVNALVLGSYAKAGNVFVTNAQVLDVGTKNLLGTASSRGDGPESVLNKQIDELSRQIARSAGLPERRIQSAKMKVKDVTTGSSEAYNYYLKGNERSTAYDHEGALQAYKQAVKLDPTFAAAFGGLSSAYWMLNKLRERDEALEKARKFSQKATEYERLRIEAEYAFVKENNPQKWRQILEETAEKYPKDKSVHNRLGFAYELNGLHEQAIEEYDKVLALDPGNANALSLIAYKYIELKNYEKAVEYFRKYISALPGEPNPFDSLAEGYFLMGRLDEAVENHKKALEVKPDFYLSMPLLAYIYALREDYSATSAWLDKYIEVGRSPGVKLLGYLRKGFYDAWLGRTEESLSDLQRSEELADAMADKKWKAGLGQLRLWVYYDRHELELSRKENEISLRIDLERNPENKAYYEARYKFALGLIELEEGKLDSARGRLKGTESVLPRFSSYLQSMKDHLQFFYHRLGSEVFLAEGSPGKVRDCVDKISALPPRDWYPTEANEVFYNTPFLQDALAKAYVKTGDFDKAIAEYERLITFDPKVESRYLIHPTYYYRLAKLYEQKGMRDKAKARYERFLELWKDADAGIPELVDAKKRLAALR